MEYISGAILGFEGQFWQTLSRQVGPLLLQHAEPVELQHPKEVLHGAVLAGHREQ